MKIFLFFICSFIVQASMGQVGKVKILKGAVFINEKPAVVGQDVQRGDKIKTMSNSYLKLVMIDSTTIQLASSSSITLTKYSEVGQPRKNNVSLLYGKLRVLVKKMAVENEQINFQANQIALGVRGTEFMLNAYESGGARTVDTLLLKGELKVSGASFENFILNKAQYFNSQALERKGLSAIKKLESNIVNKLLEGTDEFLPELRLDGGHLNLSKFFSQKLLGIIPSGVIEKGVGSAALAGVGALKDAAVGLISGTDESKEAAKKKRKKAKSAKASKSTSAAKEKTASESNVQGVTSFHYKLRNEKWDIRDAVLNRKSNIENNLCFYYIYKSLPGGSEPERFRRERRCDEFEYDL